MDQEPFGPIFFRARLEQQQQQQTAPMSASMYQIEHAKTGRAHCKACNNEILKDALRLGTRFGQGGHDGIAYRHFPECLTQRVAQNIEAAGSDCLLIDDDVDAAEVHAILKQTRGNATKVTPTAHAARSKSSKKHQLPPVPPPPPPLLPPPPPPPPTQPARASLGKRAKTPKAAARSKSPAAAPASTTSAVPPPPPPRRVPLLSNLLDIFYGSIPAPFFVLSDGELSPDAMMRVVPGWALAMVATGIGLGVAAAASVLSTTFAVSAFIPIAVHWTLFLLHGLPYESEKLFDLAGQLGFTAMSAYSFWATQSLGSQRRELVAGMCLVWSLRLGYYLFARFLERGEDWRFVKARKHAGYHFFAWTMQGVWCVLQGLSVLVMNELGARDVPLGPWDAVGFGVWVAALAVESIADLQKLAFVRRHVDRVSRPFINEGLWAYSRHPNFAGETGCWVGVFIVCAQALPPLPDWRAGLAACAPLWSAVFLQQTTVPWLEVLADRKYARDRKYVEYKRSTSVYLILPKRPAWI